MRRSKTGPNALMQHFSKRGLWIPEFTVVCLFHFVNVCADGTKVTVGPEAKWLRVLELSHESGQWHRTVLEVITFSITSTCERKNILM